MIKKKKKGNLKGDEDLPAELKQVKKQIEKDRFLHIKNAFQLNRTSVVASASHHHSLAITRSDEANNRGGKNMLSYRMAVPLHNFKALSEEDLKVLNEKSLKEDSNKEGDNGGENDNEGDNDSAVGCQEKKNDNAVELPTINLPIVERLPPFITWAHIERYQLMAPRDSVIGKEQTYYKDGEIIEFSSDEENEEDGENEEEIEKEKFEFSNNADEFIWKIGQKYGLDDVVVMSALTTSLKVDKSDILERYNELKILKNRGNVGEASDSRSKSISGSFTDSNFCRRCYIFGCQMHGPSQHVIKSKETKPYVHENEDVREPCHNHCYLKKIADDKGKNVVSFEWTPLEKDFYMEGVKVFGKDSCRITRNFLWGLKSCVEVYNYMCEQDRCTTLPEQNQSAEIGNQVNKEKPRKRNKKLRRHACYPPALKKKLAQGESMTYKQYTPCTCEPICGDQCTCLAKGNCCEKYCGCTKICKNRFGGCKCTKGQCGNRQCPCFAASRECDPDVCQSCCFSCGDGSHGETVVESQCKNMNFLRKQQKKIMLAKSDIQGWGAFTRDALKKNDFLGEYTGELITPEEANERGRADDRLGYSYLFGLNDEFVIDARRYGNKFKFLNHSATPNCYAKLMTVGGDHRIGIYAGKAIKEGEELTFDYCYGPGYAAWSSSHKPRATRGSKKLKCIKQT